jgi:formate dehydrogenase assembly factor FdhD
LAVEEPLKIRLGKSPIAVTMLTPGNDTESVIAFVNAKVDVYFGQGL